jgi:hypothetical protein
MYEHYHLHPDYAVHELFKNSQSCFHDLPTELVQNIYGYIFCTTFCSFDNILTLHYDGHQGDIRRTDIQHNLFVINLSNFVLLKRFYFRDEVLLPQHTNDVKYFTDGIYTSLIDYLIEHNILLYICILIKIHDFLPSNHFIVNWYNKTNELNYELNWLFNNFPI